MMNEDYRSAAIRSHYHDRRSQAYAFLFTIGAKALVLQEHRQIIGLDQAMFCDSTLSLSTMTDEFRLSGSPVPSAHFSGLPGVDETTTTATASRAASNHDSIRSDVAGLIDEAETRQKIILQERLRSVRRKILEKNAISVYKRGRNHKMRLIEIIVQHEKKKETYIMWKSKMNTLKKVEIDHHTQVEILPHQNCHSDSFQHEEAFARSHQLHQQYSHHGSHSHHHNYHNNVINSNGHGGKNPHNTSTNSIGSSSSVGKSVMHQGCSITNGIGALDESMFINSSSSQHARLSTVPKQVGDRRSRVNSKDSSSTNKSDLDSLAGNINQLRISNSSQTNAQQILLQHDSTDSRIITNDYESGNFSSHSITSISSAMSLSRTYYHHHVGLGLQHHNQPSKPVPFLRLKNRSRYLDLQFLTHIELEAFLFVIQKYANLELKLDNHLLTITSAGSNPNSPNLNLNSDTPHQSSTALS